jgi:hypothetical protein
MTSSRPPGPSAEPIQDFSNCHAGILGKLDLLGELPALLEPAARARIIATTAVGFFRAAIFEHHQDEERELFPAVLASAADGEERAQVQRIVRQLTDEHRALEALWKRLETPLKKVARGQAADLDVPALAQLVAQYRAHARFEEEAFLPLSQAILGRNSRHLAALGLSLHMRHTAIPVKPQI